MAAKAIVRIMISSLLLGGTASWPYTRQEKGDISCLKLSGFYIMDKMMTGIGYILGFQNTHMHVIESIIILEN